MVRVEVGLALPMVGCEKVATGHYTSASEVIREALRLMQQQDEIREAKLARLRQDVEDGFNSGLAGPLDMEEIIRKVETGL